MTEKRKLFEGHDFSDFATLKALDEGRKNISNTGAPLLPMNIIIEDPDQPRTEFDAEKLNEMAESIRERGVLQPILIKAANPDGFHVIIAGARRYRASQLAGKDMIPALVRHLATDSYDQMIENIQREALSHRDIARFIRDQMATGAKKSAIAKALGKPPAWVSLYVDFFDMDPAIQNGMNDYGTRAAYELHAAMQIDEAATRRFLAGDETITRRSAAAFHQSLKTEQETPAHPRHADGIIPASSPPINVESNANSESPGPKIETPLPAVSASPAPVSATPSIPKPIPSSTVPIHSTPDASEQSESEPVLPQEPELISATSEPSAAFAMRVRDGDRVGRLLLDREAGQGGSFGVVAFDDGAEEEARLSDLVMVEFVRDYGRRSDDA